VVDLLAASLLAIDDVGEFFEVKSGDLRGRHICR
jgi:hypothetical protein